MQRVFVGLGEERSERWPGLRIQLCQLLEQGKYGSAHPVAVEALSEAERVDPGGARTGLTLNQIGLLYRSMGRRLDAENAYLRAIRILKADPSQRLGCNNAMYNLASLYMEYGNRYLQAERLMRDILKEGLALLGPDHPDVGAMLANPGSALMMQRRIREASAVFEEALAMLEMSPASHRPNIASILSNLGCLKFQQG
jgi:tetratricopeptide (TPR) repeat protein